MLIITIVFPRAGSIISVYEIPFVKTALAIINRNIFLNQAVFVKDWINDTSIKMGAEKLAKQEYKHIF